MYTFAGLHVVLLAGAAALGLCAYVESFLCTLLLQCVYECAVGVYWPVACTYRNKYMSEKLRTTTITLFRVPLNFMVVVGLHDISSFDDTHVYLCCAVALLGMIGASMLITQ